MDSLRDPRGYPYYEPEPCRHTLHDIASRIALEVEEIETCVRMGAVDVCGDFSFYSTSVKHPRLHDHLTLAVHRPVLLDCPKREEWIDSCLARFRHYFCAPSAWHEISRAFVVSSAQPPVRLTPELITRQRFWGIQFYSKNRMHDKKIANIYLTTAIDRLASDLASVNRFCAEWQMNSTFLSTVSFSHERRGNLFEQMVFGILNQLEPVVGLTSIYDDVREWSDLRIIREGAFKGAGIQVKFTHRRTDHDVAASHSKASKTIILSPLSIATSLETTFEPDLFRCSWSELLELFPEQPKSTEELAWQIYCLFDRLFDAPPSHPLSPIIDVPYPIRLAIHLLVAHQAAELQSKQKWQLAAIKAAELESSTP